MASRATQRLPVVLLAFYLAEFSVLAIRPYDRIDWIAENIPIVLIVGFLVVTYRRFQFSNLAYVLIYSARNHSVDAGFGTAKS